MVVEAGGSDGPVRDLAGLIRIASAEWEPAVERALFATTDPDEISEVLVSFLASHLGPVQAALFYRPGVGVVAGLQLVDGRQVVVKVHRWNVSVERLRAVQAVQAHAAHSGLPAPRPLVTPRPLGRGIATAEDLMPGQPARGHDPRVRRSVAAALFDFIAACRALANEVDLGAPLVMRPPEAGFWFEPHDLRFDFSATASGAEWIDELAALARARLADTGGTSVVGHFDWRVQNLGFEDAHVVAIYDWDSLAIAPEAVVVGSAAGGFTADWASTDPDPLPTIDEMRCFVRDYESARGGRFGSSELEQLDAANLFLCAYGARCQHSDLMLHPSIGRSDRVGWIRLLRQRGDQALRP